MLFIGKKAKKAGKQHFSKKPESTPEVSGLLTTPDECVGGRRESQTPEICGAGAPARKKPTICLPFPICLKL